MCLNSGLNYVYLTDWIQIIQHILGGISKMDAIMALLSGGAFVLLVMSVVTALILNRRKKRIEQRFKDTEGDNEGNSFPLRSL